MYNKLRVAIEWGFGHIETLWAFFRDKRRLKYGSTPVGAQYVAAVLLYNFRTMVKGHNQTSKYFECPPPTLAQYLRTPRPPRLREDDVWEEYFDLVEEYGLPAP